MSMLNPLNILPQVNWYAYKDAGYLRLPPDKSFDKVIEREPAQAFRVAEKVFEDASRLADLTDLWRNLQRSLVIEIAAKKTRDGVHVAPFLEAGFRAAGTAWRGHGTTSLTLDFEEKLRAAEDPDLEPLVKAWDRVSGPDGPEYTLETLNKTALQQILRYWSRKVLEGYREIVYRQSGGEGHHLPQIVNLTMHEPTDDQKAHGVSNFRDHDAVKRLLLFENSKQLYMRQQRAEALARIAAMSGAPKALIGGHPALMGPLEKALEMEGIIPVYAFSERISKENPDTGEKYSVFKHVDFFQVP